ncbi:MAG: CDP-alcohol phosphatidyltransferase family protein [Pirellulales bacterium]
MRATPSLTAAALILFAYFFDRLDGPLARLQRSATPWGAWFDANVDEAVDLGLHVCVAAVAAKQVGEPWPWLLLVAFLFGKYLLMHGLHGSQEVTNASQKPTSDSVSSPRHPLRTWYHLPANSDVRMHLLIAAVATGWLVQELFLVACYYNLRWPLRFILVARRLQPANAVRGGA